jgi:SAM-dependent methyltransferase
MVLDPIVHLGHRVVRRVLDIRRKGFPVLHPRAGDAGFDQEYGVETSKIVWLTNIFSKNYSHSVRYEACNPPDCRWAIEAAGIDYKQFWFVDVGCGKGRPLLIASSYPFQKLIGVDYSAKLCDQAVANLRKCHIADDRFEIVCADATEFTFPDQNLFAFFYNPFDPTIIRAVLQNLESLHHRLFIAFTGQFRGELANHSWLRLVAKLNNTDLYERVRS